MTRKILIIGATSAIAQATARIFAKRRDRLYLLGRDTTRLQAVASDLEVRGASQVGFQAADLTDCAQHEQLIDTAEKYLEGLDIVLIAYGTMDDQIDAQNDFQVAQQMLNSNFISVVSFLTPLANRLEKQRYGSLAVISSVAGDRGRQSNYVYGAAKGGLSLFLQGLRNRLYPSNVQVLTIKPGFVDTPMTAHIQPKGKLWATPDQIAEGIVKAIDKRRDVVYLPWFWWGIMTIICNIPEFVFKRLKL